MKTTIETKAEKIIVDSIRKLVSNSFLMLLFEGLMIKLHPVLKDVLKEKEVKAAHDYLFDAIINLKDIVDSTEDVKAENAKKCMNIKAALLDIYENMRINVSAGNIVDLCLDEQMKQMEDESADKTEIPKMKKALKLKIERFMDEAKRLDMEDQGAAILFTVLPNYFDDKTLIDYINFSAQFYLENSPQNEAEFHIKEIKRSLAPQNLPEFGAYYKRESNKLSEIVEKLRSSEIDDIHKLSNQYSKVSAKIEGIADTISAIYTALTYLTIIFSSMFSYDNLLKIDFVYKDFYFKAKEILDSDELDEPMTETLLEQLDEYIEKEVDELMEINKRKELIYKNVNFENFPENLRTLFSMEFFMTSSFYENIDDVADGACESDDERFANPKAVKNEIRALKLFAQESCLGMSDILKTGARRNLFFSVPLASSYDRAKMLKYVDLICSRSNAVFELELSVELVDKLLDDEVLLKISQLDI